MARQETIKILRSEVLSATPSLTSGEVAVNLADRRLFVGGTGGTSDRITFRDERSTVWSVNSLTGSVTLGVGQLSDVNFEDAPEQYQFLQWNGVDEWRPAYAVTSLNNQIGSVTLTGDGESLIGRTNNSFTNRTATTGVTGVASFLSNHFTVSETGHVSSKGVITINNTSPDGNGNFNVAAATVVTGDGGSLRGDGVVITARFSSTGISGVASFSSDDFDVSATGHVTVKSGGIGNAQLANSSFTFRDSVQGSDTISLGNTLNLTGGPGISVRRTETDTFAVQGTTATTSTLGVASFNSSYFSVSSGAVSLASPYQATGDSVQAGHGIAISANKTIFNIGVTAFNGLTGNITVTGDGGSLVGRDNNKFTNRLATISVTGVASFMPSYFSVSSGAVSLAAPYQITGDTVVGSANIGVTRVGNSVTITNIGVTGIGFGSDVGLTGKVNITAGSNITITQLGNLITFSGVAQQVTAVTGDGAAIVGRDNSNITARLANIGVTGVASFMPSYFSVSSGAVSLASAYQATGDSVQAGSGIAISANKTIFNIGVTGIGFGSDVGLTGKVNITAGSNITITQSGNLITFSGVAQQVTAVTGDGAAIVGRDNSNITARLATTGVTGVASFNSTYFSVGGTGHVTLAAAYQATGDTVITVPGSGIALSTSGKTDTIFNIGVTGFNGLTGNITVTGDGGSLVGKDNNKFTNRLATTGVTGVASFLSNHFTVSGTGHVSLATGYQATGDSVQAGHGIAISANKTIFNIGVTSFNGLTGTVSLTGCGGAVRGSDNTCITVRNASSTLTGVASFNPTHFTVATTGHVSLASAYQATGDTVITVPGSGIALSTSGKTDTIFNIGVTGFNGLTGNITVTGDGGSLVGKDNNKFTNRITQLWDNTASPTTGLTGVSMFTCRDFVVSPEGLVSLAAFSQCEGDVPACNCADFTTAETCVAPCQWFIPFPSGTPTCRCPSAFNSLYSGLGVSADANGELAFLYFDIGNLSAAPSGTTILSTDSILFYDASESGLIKTKRATISKLILDNNNLFTVPSKSSNQLTTTRGSSAIEFDVVLGQVAANNQGLIKGATAFAYIEQNTVRTINGLTGALQAVGSINGCSGNSLTITGTVNEVNVTNSCPTITIGLPDNVTIPYISGMGATFTGIVNANLFIGSVDGGTF